MRLRLAQKTFDQAFFTVELYDVEWDFGRLEFKDVLIVCHLLPCSLLFLIYGLSSHWKNSAHECAVSNR